MTDRELLAEALEVMLSAVNSGDWKVDGACDPNATIVRLTNRVRLPEHEFECPRCGHCCQQREWVGLTDEEVEYPYPPVNLGTYNQGVVAERSRIVNLLLIQHEAAKDRHNYWKVAAELVQADVASDT